MPYVQVRWHPQYQHSTVIGYTVYAYIGHPLFGEIRGTRQYPTTERQAKQLARQMRAQYADQPTG